MVRNFAKSGLGLYSKPGSKKQQQNACLKILKRPVPDEQRFKAVLNNHVYSLIDAYDMNS